MMGIGNELLIDPKSKTSYSNLENSQEFVPALTKSQVY